MNHVNCLKFCHAKSFAKNSREILNLNLALIGKLTEENNPINVILSRKMLNRMNPIRCQIFEDVLFI